jgi:pyruvate/2-oxoglutarate dehydrogenase complex dihydrolipoamide acyltransferase (E2) component
MSVDVRDGAGEGDGGSAGDADGDAHIGEGAVRRCVTATTTTAAATTTTAAAAHAHHLRIADHASACLYDDFRAVPHQAHL